TTVIDARTLEVVSLNNINPNLFSLVNIDLLDRVDQSPRAFIAGFNGISTGHPFYLDNGVLAFPFASGTLRPTGRALHRITFNLADFQNETLADRYFFILPEQEYSTAMVNISRGVSLFGYEYRWNGLSSTFTIYLDDEVVASATVGQNAYYYMGGGSPRMLEVAPSLRRNNVYVPLSFFSEVLGIAATVIYEDSIVLTKHLR
ncbi:MAG: copper amine oxidase N-terminal domain-containing protein, partial [Defluviitaleaceae bacterium]|nr:copper amine oxidase N-terminal domain-containing protein [Defluviitaleaceae bacterium]